jgi:hypothetical protein
MPITDLLSRRTSIREVVPEILPRDGSAEEESTAAIATDIRRLESTRLKAEADEARARQRAEAARDEANREEARLAALREETARLEKVLQNAMHAEATEKQASRESPALAAVEETLVQALRPAPNGDVPPGTTARCAIRFWRGYRKANFCAETIDAGEQFAVAESSLFRARGNGIPERTDEAVAAHAALVEQLEAQGWRRVAGGSDWFEATFEL